MQESKEACQSDDSVSSAPETKVILDPDLPINSTFDLAIKKNPA